MAFGDSHSTKTNCRAAGLSPQEALVPYSASVQARPSGHSVFFRHETHKITPKQSYSPGQSQLQRPCLSLSLSSLLQCLPPDSPCFLQLCSSAELSSLYRNHLTPSQLAVIISSPRPKHLFRRGFVSQQSWLTPGPWPLDEFFTLLYAVAEGELSLVQMTPPLI